MKKRILAIKSNAQPAGGSVATQPVQPTATTASISELIDQLGPTVSRFRAASALGRASMPTITFGQQGLNLLGDSQDARISSIGLGERVIGVHTATISLVNADGAAAHSVSVAPHFPHSLSAANAVQINGGETSYNASGRAGLMVWGRDRRGFFQPNVTNGLGLNAGICNVTAGANLTPTLATTPMANFSGIASISVAQGATGVLTATWVSVEKLAHSRDTMLGALPLQNNQTYATLTRTVASQLLTTTNNPQVSLFSANANISATLTAYSVKNFYQYWSIPSDPNLYQPLIENSYQVIESKGFTVNTTGAEAFKYTLPSNVYYGALHVFARDTNNANLAAPTAFTKLQIRYNAGTVIPVVEDPTMARAVQWADYDSDLGAVPGYRLWDGHATTELLNLSDDAGWLDGYTAADAEFVMDVAGSVATPMVADITREVIAAGSVQELGG